MGSREFTVMFWRGVTLFDTPTRSVKPLRLTESKRINLTAPELASALLF